jgi:hypothetical protein
MFESLIGWMSENPDYIAGLVVGSGVLGTQAVGKVILAVTKTQNKKWYKWLELFCMIGGKVKDKYQDEQKKSKKTKTKKGKR